MNSSIVGPLTASDFDPDYFESSPVPVPYFDNAELCVGFVEGEDQTYLDGADVALAAFLQLGPESRNADSGILYAYYAEILKHGYTEELPVTTPGDIWNHVQPGEISLHRNEAGIFYLAVSCGCDWEEEHGLQLLFKEGRTLVRASGHDGDYSE